MQTLPASKAPTLVSYSCPVCGAPNAVNLIALSRAGRTACTLCHRALKSTDVMHAIHSPRKARGPADTPLRARATAAQPARVWPPTPESRAAIRAAEKPQ